MEHYKTIKIFEGIHKNEKTIIKFGDIEITNKNFISIKDLFR